MSERNFRTELEAGQCMPNHGCNVCRACICVLAEETIDDNDRLRACVAELETETEVWRTSNAALTSECLTLRTRIADKTNELFTANDAITRLRDRVTKLEARVIAECGHVDLLAGRAIKLEARVAELELELKPLADAADREAQLQRHKSRDATSGIARELIKCAVRWEGLRDRARDVLVKGPSTKAQDKGAA